MLPAAAEPDRAGGMRTARLLTLAMTQGHMHVQGGGVGAYLAALPQVSAACGGRIAFLTSLRQVTVLDAGDAAWRCSFHTQEEAALLAVSQQLVAMSCGNHVRSRPFADLCVSVLVCEW